MSDDLNIECAQITNDQESNRNEDELDIAPDVHIVQEDERNEDEVCSSEELDAISNVDLSLYEEKNQNEVYTKEELERVPDEYIAQDEERNEDDFYDKEDLDTVSGVHISQYEDQNQNEVYTREELDTVPNMNIAQCEERNEDELFTKEELDRVPVNQAQTEIKDNQVKKLESDNTKMAEVEHYENDDVILCHSNAMQDSENDIAGVSESNQTIAVSEKHRVSEDLENIVNRNIDKFEHNDENKKVFGNTNQKAVIDVNTKNIVAVNVNKFQKQQLKEDGALNDNFTKCHSVDVKKTNTNIISSCLSKFGSPVKQGKGMFNVVQTEKCSACYKTVYAMEKFDMNGTVYHRNCFKCSHCSARLTANTFSMNEGVIYCINHFKQLFARKGNYDEGFGRQPYTKKWPCDQK